MGESKDLIKTEEIGGEWVCRGEWKWFFGEKKRNVFPGSDLSFTSGCKNTFS